jgi:acyl dehydratase
MPTTQIPSIHHLRTMVGQEIGVSDWMTLTQEQIDQFAEATGDRQWIHTDPERAARESPYGKTIAHGFLTLSLLSHFIRQAMQIEGVRMGVNYGLNRVRFPAPVPVGAQIRARFTLQALEDIAGGVQTTWGVVIESQGSGKPCCVAEWVTRRYS